MKFYVAEGKTLEKMLALVERRRSAHKARKYFARKHKAKGTYSRGDDLCGVAFKGEPPKPWRLRKLARGSNEKFAVPDQSKEGKALRLEMNSEKYRDVGYWEVSKVLGIPPMYFPSFTPACFVVLCGHVVVGVDIRSSPKGCRRISDVEYERLLASEKTKGRKRSDHAKAGRV